MNLSNFKNVYVLSPHTDDAELGAGGTISKLVENGSNIFYFAFSTASKSVPAEFPKNILKKEVLEATSELGIKNENIFIYDFEVRKLDESRQEILEILISHKKLCFPDLVILPSINDIHQDHQIISREGIRAFKNTTIIGYELIWNNLSFNATASIELSNKNLEKKIKALSNYNSQKHRNYMQKEFITSLANIRGVQFGVKYSECFEVIRWVIN